MNASALIIIGLLFCLCSHFVGAQVKIGENLQEIDGASILELESKNRAFVLTRVSQAEMNAIVPLNGALVYNTDNQCVYMFNGAVWKSLCNAGINVTKSAVEPQINQEGDIWIDSSQNAMKIWNGSAFVAIHRNFKTGTGIPSSLNNTDAIAGDIYVDSENGNLYTFNGLNWLPQLTSTQATNGLTKNSTNTVELGGSLIRPTTITSTQSNTLAIQGLETITNSSNMVVTVDSISGILKRSSPSSLVQKEESIKIANTGQDLFTTPIEISETSKIDVYRNGIKVDFTVFDATTIQLNIGTTCFLNDEIRIIQFY
ncbi:hypothetical protein LCGC14_0711430 [marine sediment metagenome]|uniref:Uncharacterized protein n=2 Tax=root TaxID=1 RepID=A0A831QQN1_9FLAO|nr:hypothetical protein [Pricia sp.]HEA22648.1 hypothetical protein [Pricia antarctica]